MTTTKWARPYMCQQLHAVVPVTGEGGAGLFAALCGRGPAMAAWDYTRDWLPQCTACQQKLAATEGPQ